MVTMNASIMTILTFFGWFQQYMIPLMAQTCTPDPYDTCYQQQTNIDIGVTDTIEISSICYNPLISLTAESVLTPDPQQNESLTYSYQVDGGSPFTKKYAGVVSQTDPSFLRCQTGTCTWDETVIITDDLSESEGVTEISDELAIRLDSIEDFYTASDIGGTGFWYLYCYDTSQTSSPTSKPTDLPTKDPTSIPSVQPTPRPTKSPLVPGSPTESPSDGPTHIPTMEPSFEPTIGPTMPSNAPTRHPTTIPTTQPTTIPTSNPINVPSNIPTYIPTNNPTNLPTVSSMEPTNQPIEVTTTLATASLELNTTGSDDRGVVATIQSLVFYFCTFLIVSIHIHLLFSILFIFLQFQMF